MWNRALVFIGLALCGFFIGTTLEAELADSPKKVLAVGEQLVGARLSPNGRLLAGIGRQESGAWFYQVWDSTGREVLPPQLLPPPAGRFHSLSWHPGEEAFAVAALGEVWLVNPVKGTRQVLPVNWQVRHLQYTPKSLLARTDRTTFVWDSRTHKLRWRLEQKHLLHSVLDNTGERLATACYGDGVRIFDVAKKRVLAHLEPGTLSSGLKFSHSSQWLTSGFRVPGDRTQDRILTFDVAKAERVGPPLCPEGLMTFDVSNEGLEIVGSHRGGSTVWNPSNGQKLSHYQGASRLSDSISPDGRWVATTPPETRGVALWSSRDSSRKHFLECRQLASDVHFPSAKKLLVVDGEASLWMVP